jgi:hypothetical protein
MHSGQPVNTYLVPEAQPRAADMVVFVDDEPAPTRPASRHFRMLLLDNEFESVLMKTVHAGIPNVDIIHTASATRAKAWCRMNHFDVLVVETPLPKELENELLQSFATQNPEGKAIIAQSYFGRPMWLSGTDGRVYVMPSPMNPGALVETVCKLMMDPNVPAIPPPTPISPQSPAHSQIPAPAQTPFPTLPQTFRLASEPVGKVEPVTRAEPVTKAVTVTEVEPVEAELVEADDHGEEHFVVVLSRHSPMEVVQLKCLAGATATLEFVRKNRAGGRVWFERGEIVHAETESKTGIDALVELMSWVGGNIKEVVTPPCEEKTIKMPWAMLLMQVAQEADEMSAKARNAPASDF